MRYFSIIFMFLICILKAGAQSFPEAWFGKWRGELKTYPSGAVYHMEYMLTESDSVGKYRTRITYGEGEKADVRDYWLRTINREKGIYQTDERNSILIDEILMNNVLISDFTVQGTRLLILFRFESEQIIFEVFSSPSDNAKISGGKGEIPFVHSFRLNAYQRCVLRKII